jgi:heme exporter protein C
MNPVWTLANRVYATRWVVLPPLVGAAMLLMIIGAVVVAPREVVEGEVQRLFYIHVPSAIAMYLAFTVTFLASLALLWRRDMRFDTVARAAATVGVLFTVLTLVTGSLWGRPTWGTWWAWDARLTSTLVLLLLYAGYLLARSVADETDEQAARYSAVFAIVAFLDIPIIEMSVRWWRTLHPQPMVLRMPGDQVMPTEMLAVLGLGMLGILLLAVWLIVLRAETERLSVRAAELRAVLDRREEA